jgi:hypothetical protein
MVGPRAAGSSLVEISIGRRLLLLCCLVTGVFLFWDKLTCQ